LGAVGAHPIKFHIQGEKLLLWCQLILMLLLILVAAQLFSNALEHFGHRIGLSAGVTGSIFAAVATALPETIVPVLAIVAGTSSKIVNEEIGVGAILGAPLMLSTLSTGVMTLSVLRARTLKGFIKPERSGFTRDLNFFLGAFLLAGAAMFVPLQPAYYRAVISTMLIATYLLYLFCTFRASSKLVAEGFGVQPDESLMFTRFGLKNSRRTILLQLVAGIILLLFGAEGFIHGVEAAAKLLNVSVLLLSLLIIPLATELPEKVNSILWVRKNKDTLGFGNITGAMVFQGTLLPALGIMLTPWEPTRDVVNGIIITLIAALWLRINITERGIRIPALLLNGVFYLLYLIMTFG
jgi:cation:H+ antiporter